MWKQITVEQYQQITAINNQQIDEDEKIVQVISILCNLTEAQVNDLRLSTFQKYAELTADAFRSPVVRKPKNILSAKRKRYHIAQHAEQLSTGQYIEVRHWLKDGIINNLHLIAASIASPMRFRFFKGKNDSRRHKEVAADFLQANFMEVYSAVVFFCRATTDLRSNGQEFSTKTRMTMMERMKNWIDRLEAAKAHLKNAGAGFTPLQRSQNMNA